MVAIGIATVPSFARVVRSGALQVMRTEYVLAARAAGRRPLRTAVRHVLPNVGSLVIVQASVSFAIAVLAEAALSFLGFGTPPPTPSWGRMLQESQELLFIAPRLAIFPGVAIALAKSIDRYAHRVSHSPRCQRRRWLRSTFAVTGTSVHDTGSGTNSIAYSRPSSRRCLWMRMTSSKSSPMLVGSRPPTSTTTSRRKRPNAPLMRMRPPSRDQPVRPSRNARGLDDWIAGPGLRHLDAHDEPGDDAGCR